MSTNISPTWPSLAVAIADAQDAPVPLAQAAATNESNSRPSAPCGKTVNRTTPETSHYSFSFTNHLIV